VHDPDAAPDQRRQAARAFKAVAAHVSRSDGALAHVARVAASGTPQRDVAARLLAAVADARAAEALLAAYRADISPAVSYLEYLGLTTPLPTGAFAYFGEAREAERSSLTRALLRRPSAEGHVLLDALVAADDLAAGPALSAAGEWLEPARLRALADGPRRPSDMPAWLAPDLRREVAMCLALRGEADGVARLERWARGEDEGDPGPALNALAELAWPGALPLVAQTLAMAKDANTVALAAAAAGTLGVPALVEPLLLTALRAPVPPDGIPLEAEAIVRSIVGNRDPRSLSPTLRHRDGEPITLATLAVELESRHAGPRRRASGQLRAVTGEHHGYDPDLDFVANLDAIDAWQARARDPAPLSPGGWAWWGRPLPPA
jgi:hypothetical protein